MNTDEKATLGKAWAAAHEIYGKSVTDGALMLVVQALSRYELADVLRALSDHTLDSDAGRFAPKPADIARRLDGDSASVGLRAWTKAITAASSVGADRSVCFDDRLINLVIDDMGGWIKLCESPADEHGYMRAEFDRRYRGYLANKPDQWPAKLTGRIEHHNAQQWPDRVPPVTLIGDRDQARLVHERGGEAGAQALQRIGYDQAVAQVESRIKLIQGGKETQG